MLQNFAIEIQRYHLVQKEYFLLKLNFRQQKTDINLVFLQGTIWHRSVSFFLKRNNNKGDKNVDEKEGKDDEKNDVENTNFHSITGLWSFIFISRLYRVPKNTEKFRSTFENANLLKNYYFLDQVSVLCSYCTELLVKYDIDLVFSAFQSFKYELTVLMQLNNLVENHISNLHYTRSVTSKRVTSLPGPSPHNCAQATQLLSKRRSDGNPFFTLCPIWPAQDLNFRPSARKTIGQLPIGK